MKQVGYSFKSHEKHGELLRNLQEVGGLDYCPEGPLEDIVQWLTLCYIGEPSYGPFSQSRNVFYSNTGAPMAIEVIQSSKKDISEVVSNLESDPAIRSECGNKNVARRFQDIVDATSTST